MTRIKDSRYFIIGGGIAFVLLGLISYTNSAAVMSIDLGSEWMKVGVVSPGVPMEIALNKESKRKTPSVIAFREGERTFGEDAQNIGLRFPANSYGYLIDLLGKTIDNPVVKRYQERFPYYEIEADPVRNTVAFRNGNETFRIEELVAQLLQRGREFAQDFTGTPITECVLVVPGYFGQTERAAILASAKLINLKVLQLQNDYTAVALNYGIFRRKEINETAQYFLFYDMGASATSATVVSYQLVKDKATREVNPIVSVLGIGYDRNLGGLEMQLRLRDHLAKEFNALKKTKTDVTTNGRAMAKLFKEAGRVKNVLSANNEHYAQIEGLIEEIDFRVLVTREQFEKLCEDLFERVPKVLEKSLSTSGLSLDVITQVVIVGGGTRVPKVQEALKGAINQELGKNINADEAATMGAVYRAADLATGFKVKKFITRDAVLFPLQVVFEREGDSGQAKQVKRTLFGAMNPFPQKKVITFNKHTKDFSFEVNYAELDYLPKEEIEVIGNLNLAKISLSNVAQIIESSKGDNTESKGIKAHFVLDDSGLISLTSAELVLEKTVTETEEPEEESPFSKLGSTISKLFASDKSEDVKVEEEKKSDSDVPKEAGEETEPTNTTETKPVEETQEVPVASASQNKTEKPKIVIIKESIPNEVLLLHTPPLDGADLDVSKTKVKVYDDIDKARIRRETAQNKLEAFVFDAQEKLNRDEFAKCATKTETDAILKACKETSEWLEDEGSDSDAITYEKKLYELEGLTNAVYSRHWEHSERPDALKALKKMLDEAHKFFKTASNLTKTNNPEKDVFTDVEIQTLENVLIETKKWRDTEIEEQKKLLNSDEVRLTVKAVTEKMSLLDREVKYLVNKIKIWKPKVKDIPVKEKVDESKENTEEKPVIEEETEENEEAVDATTPEVENQEEKPSEEKIDATVVENEKTDHSEL